MNKIGQLEDKQFLYIIGGLILGGVVYGVKGAIIGGILGFVLSKVT